VEDGYQATVKEWHLKMYKGIIILIPCLRVSGMVLAVTCLLNSGVSIITGTLMQISLFSYPLAAVDLVIIVTIFIQSTETSLFWLRKTWYDSNNYCNCCNVVTI